MPTHDKPELPATTHRLAVQHEDGRVWISLFEGYDRDHMHAYAEAVATHREQEAAALVAEMREALDVSRDLLADALKAFGPCDHEVGICNCDMARSIKASEAALTKADAWLEGRG